MTQMEAVEYDREVAALREMLGENEFNMHWSKGEQMTTDDAIALAINNK
jgi:hypothetical protein